MCYGIYNMYGSKVYENNCTKHWGEMIQYYYSMDLICKITHYPAKVDCNS